MQSAKFIFTNSFFCDSKKGLNLILLKCEQTGKWPLQLDLIESNLTGLNLTRHDRKSESAELPCMSQYFLDLLWCCKVMVVVESLHLGKNALAFRISTTSATGFGSQCPIPDLFCGPGLLIIWNCAFS